MTFRLMACLLGAAVIGMTWTTGSARAADPVFPPGSRIGLAPPAAMVVSKTFSGFEDPANSVAIALVELGKSAMGDIEKSFGPDALKAQGAEIETREDVALKDGHGLLLKAHQEIAGFKVHKWLLIAAVGEITAVVSVQVPDAAQATYPDEVVRASLTSVAVRGAVPSEEQLAILPFALKDLAGFRIVRAGPQGSALLTDGPNDVYELPDQPLVVISLAPAAPEDQSDRANLARRAMSTTPGVKEMRIQSSESMRIGGQPGQEMIVQAKDAKSDTPLTLVQWLRFGSGGYLRLLGVVRADEWTKVFPRFRAIRDGIAPK